ncbi:MAG TPA: hypothetical protein VGL82_06125 [Bryobacteraceae bacterium]
MKINNRYWIVLGTAALLTAASAPTPIDIHEDNPFPESLSSRC